MHLHGHAKSVVGILEMRRDAGASGAATDLDVVTPRASTRSAAGAGFGAGRGVIGGEGVIAGVVPVATPLMHVGADIENTERVRRGHADGLGSGLPSAGVIWQRFRGSVSPGKASAFNANPSAAFPLSFEGGGVNAAP